MARRGLPSAGAILGVAFVATAISADRSNALSAALAFMFCGHGWLPCCGSDSGPFGGSRHEEIVLAPFLGCGDLGGCGIGG